MAETAELLIARREAAQAEKAAAEAEAKAAKTPAPPSRKPWTHRGSADLVDPTTPRGAGSAAGLVMIAGTIAFLGSMREAKMFPPNGVRIIFSTLLLAIVISLFERGQLAPVVRALGWLMVLSALIRYVPKFSQKGK